MKKFILIIFLALACTSSYTAEAQIVSTIDSTKTYVVIKHDGTQYIGKILSKDGREVLINTDKIGEIYIPMSEVAEIKEFTNSKGVNGEYIYDDPFATRYFLTTNALPLDKGETYALFNWFGPEIHWGASDRFGVGLMTTWITIPIVASLKYSIPLNEDEDINLGLGALIGGIWIGDGIAGALPFMSLTFGDRASNLSFTGGGVFTTESDLQPLFSVGGLTTISKKMSFIFDSMIIIPKDATQSMGGSFSPGLRFQSKKNDNAFQFGFMLAAYDG